MGRWSIGSIDGNARPLSTNSIGDMGHAVLVTMSLRYTPARFSRWTEPLLEWNEVFEVNDGAANTHWTFGANMYQHNSDSQTFLGWRGRYIFAYNVAQHGLAANDAGRCDAVRRYLRRHGGVIDVRIQDNPCLRAPQAGEHKQRRLRFDIGITGDHTRLLMEQYLELNAIHVPQVRTFQVSTNGHNTLGGAGFARHGLMVVPPDAVRLPRPRRGVSNGEVY